MVPILMTNASSLISDFSLKGELLKLRYKKNELKSLKLAANQQKYRIKVPKKLRAQVSSLNQGCILEISGQSRQDCATGKTKYKAHTVVVVPQEPLNDSSQTNDFSLLPIFNNRLKPKAKVLICQKSNCWKKGGKKIYQELERILSDRGIVGEIPLKKTGCLKQCKKAPAMIMLPDKARYTRVKPQQIENLVKKHLLAE